jgi:hypothetical protein
MITYRRLAVWPVLELTLPLRLVGLSLDAVSLLFPAFDYA